MAGQGVQQAEEVVEAGGTEHQIRRMLVPRVGQEVLNEEVAGPVERQYV